MPRWRSSRGRGRRLFHRQAGDGLEDAVDLLDLVDDQGADGVHVRGLADGDDVVLTGDGVRGGDARHALHLLGHLQGTPGRRVDEDVRLHLLTPTQYGTERDQSTLSCGVCPPGAAPASSTPD